MHSRPPYEKLPATIFESTFWRFKVKFSLRSILMYPSGYISFKSIKSYTKCTYKSGTIRNMLQCSTRFCQFNQRLGGQLVWARVYTKISVPLRQFVRCMGHFMQLSRCIAIRRCKCFEEILGRAAYKVSSQWQLQNNKSDKQWTTVKTLCHIIMIDQCIGQNRISDDIWPFWDHLY